MSGEEHTILQVNEETEAPDWVSRTNHQLEELKKNRSEKLKRWKETSIYLIPPSLKDLCKEAYQPQMVAIGPYHRGDEHLKAMEEHKMRALLKFLDRSDKSLEHYVNALTPSVQKFKNAYQELQTDDEFLKMMIVDGCFMLELMRTSINPNGDGYEAEDPIFSKHGHLYCAPYLTRDMLMLENQLPLQVLKELVDAEGRWKEKDQLTKCILEFFDRRERIKDSEKIENCLHVLDLYRKSLLLLKEVKTRAPSLCSEMVEGGCLLGWCSKKKQKENMRSARELSEAWIRLERSNTSCLDDIEFSGRDLKLPRIKVDDATKHLYLNLMAWERMHAVGNEVTSYVFFMDKLIDSAEDVSLLHWHGIMENLLGSDQEVANLFNKLSTDICPDNQTVFSDVQLRVAKYYGLPVPHCIAYAQHTYFTNPWVILSVVAAIFLFALTILQTFYAILDYRKK